MSRQRNREDKRPALVRGWEIFGDIFMLNIMFVICSLPVITVGASLCALYAVAIKMVNKEDGSITKSFLREFKRNFKQGTAAWLLELLALTALWGEFYYVLNYSNAMTKVYIVVVAVEAVTLAMVLPFLYPLIARYENTLWNSIKNSFLLAVGNFGKWLKVFLAWFAPLFLTIINASVFFNVWYLWLLIAFGLIAYGTSHSILFVFDRVSEVKEEQENRESKEEEKRNTHGGIRKRAMMGVEEDEQDGVCDDH